MNDLSKWSTEGHTVDLSSDPFNDWWEGLFDDSVAGMSTKHRPREQDHMIPYMVGNLVPNQLPFTKALVKYVPGRGFFRTEHFTG